MNTTKLDLQPAARSVSNRQRSASLLFALLLVASACSSAGSELTTESVAPTAASEPAQQPAAPTEAATTETATAETAPTETATSETAPTETAIAPDTPTSEAASSPENNDAVPPTGCNEVAALFVSRGSANANLDDPEVTATCEGDELIVSSNGIPDYTYIGTSPGEPRDRDLTFTIPASPTVADAVTAIPYIGEAAVTLGGIPIFGPTEGTGGDVESLPGILSDCGSHNGPSGFHIHLILTSSETDCLFTPEQVAVEPQLVGYAFDGFPIYTGIDQYTSSWQLTDDSLFATDTWAAHSYVEGSGDLDECNGLTDADGNYAYYTTATFPYVLGCFTGVVELSGAGAGAGGGGGGDRPERPEDTEDAEGVEGGDGDRPERPEGGGGDRPERPEDAEGERPEGDEGA